jgi:hypothetical protein
LSTPMSNMTVATSMIVATNDYVHGNRYNYNA